MILGYKSENRDEGRTVPRDRCLTTTLRKVIPSVLLVRTTRELIKGQPAVATVQLASGILRRRRGKAV